MGWVLAAGPLVELPARPAAASGVCAQRERPPRPHGRCFQPEHLSTQSVGGYTVPFVLTDRRVRGSLPDRGRARRTRPLRKNRRFVLEKLGRTWPVQPTTSPQATVGSSGAIKSLWAKKPLYRDLITPGGIDQRLDTGPNLHLSNRPDPADVAGFDSIDTRANPE